MGKQIELYTSEDNKIVLLVNLDRDTVWLTQDGKTQIEVKFDVETVWLNQKQMSDLFEKDTDTIGLHLKNIFAEDELEESATAEFFSVVQKEGNREVKRNIKFYNLDAVLSVGYRVNSKRGAQFRQWATQRLKDYLVKGYAVNQKRLDELGKMVQLIAQSGETESLQIQEADFRERSLKDVITQLEPGLFKKVTGLSVRDFELLVSLGVFNSALMNDAVYKFKRYEDASLEYIGINKHTGEDIGLYDTVISRQDYEDSFVNEPE